MSRVIQIYSSENDDAPVDLLPKSMLTRSPESVRHIIESLGDGLTWYSAMALAGLAFVNACDGVEVFSVGFMISVLTNDNQQPGDGSLFPSKPIILSSTAAATFSALMFVGMMSGGLITGPLATRFGRRILLLLCVLLAFLSNIVVCESPDQYTLMVSKFLTGLGVGMSTPLIFATASELFPYTQLGFALSCLSLCWIVGAMYASGMGYLLLSYWDFSWRAYTFACSIPSLIGLILCAFFVDESPFFTVARRSPVLATRTIRRFTGRGVMTRIRHFFHRCAHPQPLEDPSLQIQSAHARPLLSTPSGSPTSANSTTALIDTTTIPCLVYSFADVQHLTHSIDGGEKYSADTIEREHMIPCQDHHHGIELWKVDKLDAEQCDFLLTYLSREWSKPVQSPQFSNEIQSTLQSTGSGSIPLPTDDGYLEDEYASADIEQPSAKQHAALDAEPYSLLLLFLLACIWFVVSFGSAGFSVWLPKLLSKLFADASDDDQDGGDDTDSSSDASAYITTFLYSCIQIPACLCVMYFISRVYNPRYLLICLTGCMVSVAVLTGIYQYTYAAVAFVCCYQLFMTMIWTTLNSVSLQYFPAHIRTFTFAIQNSTGKTGAIAAQYLFGMLVENHTRLLFIIVILFFLLAVGVAAIFEKRARDVDGDVVVFKWNTKQTTSAQ